MPDTGPLVIEVDTVVEISPRALPDNVEGELAGLAWLVLDAEGKTGRWEVAFVLVDDDRLQALHRDFMDIDEPTDVMTFERTPDDGEPGDPSQGGDIIISVERAAEQSVRNGNTPAREVLFLAVHGLLHLTGWTDHSEGERAAMLARGEAILRQSPQSHGG